MVTAMMTEILLELYSQPKPITIFPNYSSMYYYLYTGSHGLLVVFIPTVYNMLLRNMVLDSYKPCLQLVKSAINYADASTWDMIRLIPASSK
jgi:hypothetical protein